MNYLEELAVEVAFRNYERSVAAPLKSVLDRDWEDESLYSVAQIAANAITYRDREIAQLKKEIKVLKEVKTTYGSCTAELEVKLQKLAAYFEKRAKENTKRAKDKEEQSKSLRVGGFCSNWANEAENSGYYFSGKADSYRRASEKVKELLREPEEPTVSDAPAEKWIGDPEEPTFSDAPAEKWVVECHFPEGWLPSGNTGLCKVEFASEEEAQRAIEEYGSEPLKYRVVRKGLATLHQDVPEKWIVEAEFYSGWYRSASVPEEFTTKSEADAAIAKQTDGVLRRASKVK